MNTSVRAFADEANAVSTTPVPEIVGLFFAATLIVSTPYTLAHAAHLA